MKKTSIVMVVVFLLLTLSLFIFSGLEKSLIGDGITLYHTVLADKPTTQGFVYIPFTSTHDGDLYANVGIDVNGDGIFASYESSAGVQEEWVVRNSFAEVFSGEANRFAIYIVDPTFGEKPISGTALLTDEVLLGTVWNGAWAGDAKEMKEFTITNIQREVRDIHMTLDPTGKLATGRPLAMGVSIAYAQAVAPVAPGDYYARHMEVPDQNQQWNECAPTAISNSFRFLAKKYNMEDRMPKGDVNDLIDEIKGDVAWNDGVAHENIISGKNEFIKRHDLPLEAHQIGFSDDPDIVSKIAAEIEKGQAIEAWLAFYNASGTPAGAHLVTVVGAGRKDGKDIVRFTDPDTLGAPSRDLYEVQGGNYLPSYWPGAQTYIRYAYAQSPIKELTDKTWVDPRGETAVAVGGGGRPLTEPEEDVTLARSQFGFFSTSVGHPGDHYVGDTFSVRATVYKTGKKRDVEFTSASGEVSVFSHGAKSPWTLKGKFEGSGVVTPSVALDRPPTTSLQQERFSAEQSFTCEAPGFATVAFTAELGWTSPGEPPAEVKRFTHGTEFESTADTMRVESPAFRCIAKPEVKKEEPRAAAQQSRTSITATCPGITEDPSSNKIVVLKQGTECFPVSQFREATPDKCDAVHWHANSGSALSLTGKIWVDPSGCGFGKTSEVPALQIRLTVDQLAPFIE